MRKKVVTLLVLLIIIVLTGCNSITENSDSIKKHPMYLDFERGKLIEFPPKDNNSISFQVDLRGYDLSDLDLKNQYDFLVKADFDSKTNWTNNIPDNFYPDIIMELGKNPGLGLKDIHKEGITGKGISVAIIDQTLLVDHIEYVDRIKLYEEINIYSNYASIHGAAVASILAGKTVGVAPQADIYYIAVTPGRYNGNQFVYDFSYTAKAIDRIIEINETLPDYEKIRAISISNGWDSTQNGFDEVMSAVERAQKKDIFVVSSNLSVIYGFKFQGLGREVYDDPENPNSYKPGMFWSDAYFSETLQLDNYLLFPMDSRATASPTGNSDYCFYNFGGWSWSIPYIAGLYALACQVEVDITPEIFWEIAIQTGDTIKINNNGMESEFGKIINPKELFNEIKKLNN